MFARLLVLLSLVATVAAFVATPTRAKFAVKPLQENFLLDLPTLNDPNKITPKLLNGEENYRNFVGKYDPDALLLGGGAYAPIRRVRELGLLSLTVDAGLLQVLQDKGVTLTQLERALPIIDNAGLLPLLLKNKDLLVGVLPLLIEPAPLLLPAVASVLSTSASTYSTIGIACLGAAGFEGIAEGNVVLAAVAVLLSAPAFVLSLVLGKISEPLPPVSSFAVATVSAGSGPVVSIGGKIVRDNSVQASSSRPRAAAKKVVVKAPDAPFKASAAPRALGSSKAATKSTAPKKVARAAAPMAAATPAKSFGGLEVPAPIGGLVFWQGEGNGKRKVVRVN